MISMAAAEQVRAEATGWEPTIRTRAQGWLAKPPELRYSDEEVAVCRLVVIGKAAGPASRPPRESRVRMLVMHPAWRHSYPGT